MQLSGGLAAHLLLPTRLLDRGVFFVSPGLANSPTIALMIFVVGISPTSVVEISRRPVGIPRGVRVIPEQHLAAAGPFRRCSSGGRLVHNLDPLPGVLD